MRNILVKNKDFKIPMILKYISSRRWYHRSAIILLSSSIFLSSCFAKHDGDGELHPGYYILKEHKLDDKEKAALADECAHWFDSVLNKPNFNGGILVAKNGVPVFEYYNGLEHINKGNPIDAFTPFHIASVSKTFTAMGIMLLQQDNLLNIDSSLSSFFPEVDLPGVTLRTLLNHRSGLPNYAYFMEDLKWNKKITMTNADILDALAHRKKEIKNIDRANTYFSYSNTNYALLALVIEKISGKSYGTFMKERFFDPLKMENTFVYHPDSTNVLPSYDYKGQVIPNNHLDMIYGDKNIYSTTHDLLQWSRGLEEGVIFKPETLEEVYKPYSNEKPGVKNYGLGWRMNIYPDGNKVTFHNGWWHGNNAVFVQTPSIGATIIVLGNKYNRTIYKANQLLKFFIKNSNHDQFSHEE